MQIEHFMNNAKRVIDRLEHQIEERIGMVRRKSDWTVYAIFEARVDQLKALGVMPNRVHELEGQLKVLRDELHQKEAA